MTISLDMLLRLAVVACCVGIVFASVCRVNALRYKNHSVWWIAKYIVYAVFAWALAGQLIDAELPSKAELLALVALGLNLLTTSQSWAGGPPPIASKERADRRG